MTPALFARGAPGEDLGYAHTLKHWMNPREMWEDIADGVPEHARPRAQWEAWIAHGVDPVVEATAPSAALSALWRELEPAWKEGYAATVLRRAAPLSDPPNGWLWRVSRGRWVVHAGAGVLIEVQKSQGIWSLYTAYRAVDFKLRDYRCPPQDAASVSLRMTLAESGARKRIAVLRAQGSQS